MTVQGQGYVPPYSPKQLSVVRFWVLTAVTPVFGFMGSDTMQSSRSVMTFLRMMMTPPLLGVDLPYRSSKVLGYVNIRLQTTRHQISKGARI